MPCCTIGFVLDEHQRKMSKSLGNIVEPSDIILARLGASKTSSKRKADSVAPAKISSARAGSDLDAGDTRTDVPTDAAEGFGADTLRLWAASADFSKDLSIGRVAIDTVVQSLRKVRNTARFLLSNLNDFNPATAWLTRDEMLPLDLYMLSQLHAYEAEVQAAYASNNFVQWYSATTQFTSVLLSSFYFEATKVRLYTLDPTSLDRRSCQIVLAETLRVLTHSIAPVLSFMAEDIFDHTPDALRSIFDPVFLNAVRESQKRSAVVPCAAATSYKSVFDTPWVNLPDSYHNQELDEVCGEPPRFFFVCVIVVVLID